MTWWKTIGLLALSNVFMTFAWYAHLRDLRDRPLWVAILVSWGIAFFEYCLQVPANRIGYGMLQLGQLKVLQEVITMIVFMGFAWLYMKRPVSLDFVWATLCLCGAAYFVFRGGGAASAPGQ
ncbi:MAG: DMT family protein [Sandaracinaceae bacterium]